MGGKKVWELVLEIGHKSTPLTKKLSNGYTHKWTAFVKGASNSKIEHCVSKVVFQLHDSFENPYRDITEPPFQIKETGYAGFEIPIQIFFKNRDKPNHLGFVHDLTLLNNKPNNHSTMEKIKFINPNKEFEKFLIKSGAQLLSAPPKRGCESPPAKKQKSSSLIPSKDMSKVGHSAKHHTQHLNHQSNQHHHHHHHHSNHQQQHHQQQPHHHSQQHQHHQQQQSNYQHPPQNHHHSQHQQNSGNKPKSSNSFVDIFGKPLVYNHSFVKDTKNTSKPESEIVTDPLLQIRNKISSLKDCDRLQRIVDIVEESGEWFNVTSNKFEFDLKRLDEKTISTIESLIN